MAVSLNECRALIVDDDAFTRAMLADQLRDCGLAAIREARDGAQGIDEIARWSPDVVLCDLNMPGEDGFQLLQRLGADHFEGGVIVVTGTGDRVKQSASLMARFHGLQVLACLAKPVARAELAGALKKLGHARLSVR